MLSITIKSGIGKPVQERLILEITPIPNKKVTKINKSILLRTKQNKQKNPKKNSTH